MLAWCYFIQPLWMHMNVAFSTTLGRKDDPERWSNWLAATWKFPHLIPGLSPWISCLMQPCLTCRLLRVFICTHSKEEEEKERTPSIWILLVPCHLFYLSWVPSQWFGSFKNPHFLGRYVSYITLQQMITNLALKSIFSSFQLGQTGKGMLWFDSGCLPYHIIFCHLGKMWNSPLIFICLIRSRGNSSSKSCWRT